MFHHSYVVWAGRWTIYSPVELYTTTYDHIHEKIRDPVRSPLVKLMRAELVLRSVTTGESSVLYVFAVFAGWAFFHVDILISRVLAAAGDIGGPALLSLCCGRLLENMIFVGLLASGICHRLSYPLQPPPRAYDGK